MKEEILSKLLDVIKAINSELNLARQLELIMDSLVEISQAERGFLLLAQNNELKVKVARNMLKAEVEDAHQKISRTILNRALESSKPLILTDAVKDMGLSTADSVQSQKLRSVCVLPLRMRNKLIGAAYLDNSHAGVFANSELATLEAFANQISVAINNAILFQSKEEELSHVSAELEKERGLAADKYNIVGKSRPMQNIFKLLDRVVNVDFPVLINGESGTGKELIAKAIHYNSARKDKPFLAINCGSIPDTLIESEFFGYKKGAFSGADKDKMGLFELAGGGTLFLDEVGNSSKTLQETLLRVLQEGEFIPLGAKETAKVDVRIISASNIDLAQLASDGLFRSDLYYRLNVININLPPLRERRDDIPLLVEHFLDKTARQTKLARRRVTKEVLWLLAEYNWRGNIRELENVIKQATTLSESDILTEKDFKQFLKKREAVEIVPIDDYIRETYERCVASNMSYKEIAKRLGITEKALWEKRKTWET